MYNRLSESMPDLSTEADEMAVLDSAFAALQIGASLIDLREISSTPSLPARWQEILNRGLDQLATLGTRTAEVVASLHDDARQLLAGITGLDASSEGAQQKLLLVRSAASLEGIALLLADQSPVFHRVRQEAQGVAA
jgi:hypothetical protein